MGNDTMNFMGYTVDIYSEIPGKVFYAYKREENPKVDVVEEKRTEEQKQEIHSHTLESDWVPIGEGVVGGLIATGVVVVVAVELIAGLYHYVTTGDPTLMNQGWTALTNGSY